MIWILKVLKLPSWYYFTLILLRQIDPNLAADSASTFFFIFFFIFWTLFGIQGNKPRFLRTAILYDKNRGISFLLIRSIKYTRYYQEI